MCAIVASIDALTKSLAAGGTDNLGAISQQVAVALREGIRAHFQNLEEEEDLVSRG